MLKYIFNTSLTGYVETFAVESKRKTLNIFQPAGESLQRFRHDQECVGLLFVQNFLKTVAEFYAFGGIKSSSYLFNDPVGSGIGKTDVIAAVECL